MVVTADNRASSQGKTYRLPTEAEWEYACRAVTKTAWSFGDEEKVLGDYAWSLSKSRIIAFSRYAHQVGLKMPNAFGLYNMQGNLFEWCHDYYGADYYKNSPEQDPTGPTSGSIRVLRGGLWFFLTRQTRSAARDSLAADKTHYFHLGFRVVRELD